MILWLVPLVFTSVPPQAQDTAYFQQGVEYRIEARLDEPSNVLSGRERMHYTNRSTRTLDTLWFHLHLNAFRPNSAWARRELQFDNRRFTDLGPDDYAFERWKAVTVDSQPVTPVWPGAPDSTVAGLPLSTPLAPGASVTVVIDWDARLSTTPRRQGRRGRHYDFAQWYPKVAVFDRDGWEVQPLMPQGEFYGEFAIYDVTLDVAADQVMGATGVPVEGDPGWSSARAPGTPEPDLRRDAYSPATAEPIGFFEKPVQPGRKRVRWRAENAHHFAWTTSPNYTYEGGSYGKVAIHVLYQPGDTAWAGGVTVKRTAVALAWLDTIFGPFAWPQITNVHRIEGGGTEFPMMVMNGSSGQSLIVHEVGHNYVMGILANNEWKQGWLDEGFTSFQTNWFLESRGQDAQAVWGSDMESIRRMERAGMTEPIAYRSAAFRDFNIYNAMTYTKPSLVYRMLRDLVGEDAFRKGLHLYYERNKLHHVREEDFRAAMEEASGRDLRWFFQQWIHTTATLDYSVGEVSTRQVGTSWETRVQVKRAGDAWEPVRLQVGDQRQLVDGHDATQIVTVRTATRPTEVILDPDNVLIDLDPANNRKAVR